MGDDDRSGFVLYGGIENFSWMYQRLIERTDTDDMRVDHPAGTIEGEHQEVLFVLMVVRFQIAIDTASIADDGIVYDTVVA